MNRYRTVPGLSGPPKAGASTVCQKCLKKDESYTLCDMVHGHANVQSRHYSYECKATAQERPYVSRPSRTQQLLNPRLAPKLTNDAPSDLLTRTGIADQELAKFEKQRNEIPGQPSPSPPRSLSHAQRRPRSQSVSSSGSVSTISTNKSRSISPPRGTGRQGGDEYVTSQQMYPGVSRTRSRHHKRKHSSSPEYSPSRSPPPRIDKNRKSRRHRTISPDDRGRHSYNRRGSHRSKSRSQSIDKSRVTRERRSLDEGSKAETKQDEERIPLRGEEMPDRRNGRAHQQTFGGVANAERDPPRRKGRSLSPYSRRLALTQAMNIPRR